MLDTDPKILGNCGSDFEGPKIVDPTEFRYLTIIFYLIGTRSWSLYLPVLKHLSEMK